MDQWCGGDLFGFEASVPTTCATLTMLIVMPSSLMVVISIMQIRYFHEQIRSRDASIFRGWNHSLYFFVSCCGAEILFSVVFSLDDRKSPALLTGVAAHCAAWLLLAVKAAYSLAATRHRLAVDLTSWGFFIVDFVGIGLLALGQYTEARTPLNLAAAICNFSLGLVVLVFSFYVQYLNSRQSYRTVKSSDSLKNGCCSNCFDYLFTRIYGDRVQRYSFESVSDENRRSFWSIHSDTKSWWGDSSNEEGEMLWKLANQPLLVDDATREGLLSAAGAGGERSLDRVHESSALSALERRLARPQSSAFDNGNNAGYVDGQVVFQKDPVVMTGVLQRALDRRKRPSGGGGTDIFTDDMSLAPGAASSGGGNMQEFSVIIHRWALLRERVRGSSVGIDGADGAAAAPPMFSAAGCADGDASGSGDAVIDLESGGSIHDPYQRQQHKRKSRGRSFSGNNINPDDLLTSAGSAADSAQVEFEISIRCGPCAEMEWWGRSKGIQPSLSKWTVWKTASQIEDLHRSMLSLYGDLAPRRPRLHTSRSFALSQLQERSTSSSSPSSAVRRASMSPETAARRSSASPLVAADAAASPERGMQKSSSYTSLPEDSSVTREEIAADMRAIAGYLRAMLNQPAMHCTALFQFLDVPDHLIGSFRGSKAHRQTEKDYEPAHPSISGAGISNASAFAHAEGVAAISEASAVDDRDDEADVDERQLWQSQEEEKWRKLYMNLRKGAKPREILKRCYVFEGCVTGADIVKWLTTKGSIGSVKEAESIGDGLVKVGRLIPVCLGLNAGQERRGSNGTLGEPSSGQAAVAGGGEAGEADHSGGETRALGELASKFCNSVSYIYTYPGPSKPSPQKSKPLYHLFGDVISVSIPGMARRTVAPLEGSVDPAEDLKSADQTFSFEMRDSVSISSGQSENFGALRDAVRPLSPSAALSPRLPDESTADSHGGDVSVSDGNDGYIEYEIRSQNSLEEWTVFRRYKEFVALNRLLHKAGIRPKEPLPSQLLGRLTQQSNPKRLEERRVQLQAYLRSAITTVVQAHIAAAKSAASTLQKSEENTPVANSGIASIKGNKHISSEIEKAMASLAKFLDKDFDKLRLIQAQ